jgi:hypothetical protein
LRRGARPSDSARQLLVKEGILAPRPFKITPRVEVAEPAKPAAKAEAATAEPVAQETAAEAPVAEEPAAEAPVAEEPAVADAAAEETAVVEAAAAEPAIEDSAAEEPAAVAEESAE